DQAVGTIVSRGRPLSSAARRAQRPFRSPRLELCHAAPVGPSAESIVGRLALRIGSRKPQLLRCQACSACFQCSPPVPPVFRWLCCDASSPPPWSLTPRHLGQWGPLSW